MLYYSHTNLTVTTEVEWYKGYPYNTRDVHSEAYELGLVEVSRYVARVDGVESTETDQQEVESQRAEYSVNRDFTLEAGRVQSRVNHLLERR